MKRIRCSLAANHRQPARGVLIDHLLRTDRWALIRYGRGGIELYDMQSDPHQFTNLANEPKHKRILAELQDSLDLKLKSMR